MLSMLFPVPPFPFLPAIHEKSLDLLSISPRHPHQDLSTDSLPVVPFTLFICQVYI
jgi:hypothetical protein